MIPAQITVDAEIKETLDKRKIAAEHKVGHSITWGEFLLEATS